MKKSFYFGSLYFLFLAHSYGASNYRAPFAPIGEGAYEIKANADIFNSSGHYDHDGLEESLGEGQAFSVINSRLNLMYGYGENLQFLAGVGFRSVSAEYLVSGESITTSKSGLESYSLGIRYSWKQDAQWFYSLDFKTAQTGYTNSDYTNLSAVPNEEVILGDSGNSYEAALGLTYLLTNDWFLNFKGAYRQPGNNLSPEIDYLVESSWLWSSLSASIGVEGVYALGSDEYSDNTNAKPLQGRAPSYLYNSINHVIVSPKIRVGWGIGSWRIDFYGSQVMAGKSTDIGSTLGVQLVKFSAPTKKVSKTDDAFKEYGIEATVLKVSPKGRFVQIDQGVSQDIEKGMRFDFYETDFFGGNELIATGIVYEVSLNRSIVKIIKKYSKKNVHKGFTGRAQLTK